MVMAAILFAGLVIAYVTTADYGESWDEAANTAYANASLQAYFGSREFMAYGNQVYHGPFYVMLWRLGSHALKGLHAGWLTVDAGHFTNFIVYTLGAAGFYIICLKLASPAAALGGAALFYLQPMLYGYAFINQKDIPFMAFMILAVAAGIVVVDRMAGGSSDQRLLTKQRWKALTDGAFKVDAQGIREVIDDHLVIAILVAMLVIFSATILVGWPYKGWLDTFVARVYAGQSWEILNRWFAQVAQNQETLSVESYVAKADALFTQARIVFGGLLALVGAIGLKRLFPTSLQGVDRSWARRSALWLAAGALTGLATGIRVAGPLAGGLVSVYMLYKQGHGALAPLIMYWLAAALTMYAAWPYLWGAPIDHLVVSFDVMSNFSPHSVLYKGVYLRSDMLPWDYLGTLMGLELTLPALVLSFWGSVVVIKGLASGKQDPAAAAIPVLWIGIPFLAFVVLRTPIYGNIRQVLFALPPIFLLSAVGLDDIWKRVRWNVLGLAIMALALLPSVIGIAALYPYEYVYFNALAGGVRGADGVYELDHWCTSYREAMDFVNRTAPKDVTVAVWGPVAAAADFARSDLKTLSVTDATRPEYVLGCKRALGDPAFYPNYSTGFEVERETAVLAEVRVIDDH